MKWYRQVGAHIPRPLVFHSPKHIPTQFHGPRLSRWNRLAVFSVSPVTQVRWVLRNSNVFHVRLQAIVRVCSYKSHSFRFSRIFFLIPRGSFTDEWRKKKKKCRNQLGSGRTYHCVLDQLDIDILLHRPTWREIFAVNNRLHRRCQSSYNDRRRTICGACRARNRLSSIAAHLFCATHDTAKWHVCRRRLLDLVVPLRILVRRLMSGDWMATRMTSSPIQMWISLSTASLC